MKTKTVIGLLKAAFVALILICLMQTAFTLAGGQKATLSTSLFSLQIPLELTDEAAVRSIGLYVLACALPVYAICFFVIVKLIRILRPLSERSSPFTAESAAGVRSIGLALWIYAAVKTAIEAAGGYIIVQAELPGLSQLNSMIAFPVNEFIAGAVVLALAEIFAHGLALKQDNDSIV
jgi:hypothetical protein